MLWVGCFFLFSLLAGCKNENEEKPQIQTIKFEPPAHFPKPVYDLALNPVTTSGFELGRALFYDGKLSRDGSISCGSCHMQSSAFTHHGHDVSHGIDDKLGKRNTPAIMNTAWQTGFFWDGGVFHLDVAPLNAIQNPVEMDEKIDVVLEKLRNDKDYPARFKEAFGTTEITSPRFFKALAQFMNMCNSWSSKWDQVQNGTATFSTEELQGELIFQQHCSTCHKPPLFTDHSFRNNGLAPTRVNDKGRFEITHAESDLYAFKVPTLRNLKFTAPYMHDGRFTNLDQVFNHYQQVVDSPSLDRLLKRNNSLGIQLSVEERQQLKAFLNTLYDEEFIRNPILAESFNR